MDWTLTKKSWIAHPIDYYGQGSVSLYYRKSDITHALSICAAGVPHLADDYVPSSTWNNYTDVGALVVEMVQPYRIVVK